MTKNKLLSIISLAFFLSGCQNQELDLSTCQEKIKSFNMPNSFFEFIWQSGDAIESLKCFAMVNKDITEAKEKAEERLKNFKPNSEAIKESEEYKKLSSELETKDDEIKKLNENLNKMKEKMTKSPFDSIRKKEQIN